MGGRPSALGSGRSGPRGVGRPLPSPPGSASPPPPPPAPHHTRGRGAAPPRRRRSTPPRPSGGGYPAAVVRAGAVRRAPARPASPVCACARTVGLGGGRWEPPGRLWGVRARPARGVGAGRPVVKPSGPLRSACFLSDLAGQRQPLRGKVPCHRRGPPPPEKPRETKTRTTLSGGSLGSCVDEERS